jgi:hypothetical protein
MYIYKLEETRKDHIAQLAEKEKALEQISKKQQSLAELQSKLRLEELEEHTLAKQKECNILQERCASLEAQNNELQQRLNEFHKKQAPREKRETLDTHPKVHAGRQSNGQERWKSHRSLPQSQPIFSPRKHEEIGRAKKDQQSQIHSARGPQDADKTQGHEGWSNGVFDTKNQAPVEFVLENIAQNIRESFLSACVQGAPCSGIDRNCEQDVSGEMHHSVGEVCIAEFASPRPQNRYRARATSPGVGTKRVDGDAHLAALPMQVSSTEGGKEVATNSESALQEHSGFLDDVKLRADALRSNGNLSARHLARDGHCIDEEEGPTNEPHPGDRSFTPRNDFDSPSDDVISDLNNALQGLPADASGFGNSLDESMMGASVDESVSGTGFCVPDLPIPRLGETRARAPSAVAPKLQPPRTVFFPQPPVHSSPLVYHSGHYQGWSQRTTKRGSSPS